MPSLRSILLLTAYDLVQRAVSRRGLVFLVPFGLFWYWSLGHLADGGAQWLARPEAGLFAAWLLNPNLAITLLREQPPTLSVFYYLGLTTMPFFMVLAASNQTSSDRSSRYFRILLPRAARAEIYLARLLSVSLLAALAITLVWAASLWISIGRDQREPAEVIGLGLRLVPVLLLYSLCFSTLMAMVSALVGSAAVSALLGLCGYLLLGALFAYLAGHWPESGFLPYLLPGSLRLVLLDLHHPGWWTAVLMLPLYVAAYGLFGWLIFRSRDL